MIKFTEETLEKVEVFLKNIEQGNTIHTASLNSGLSRQCFYNWRKNSEENKKRYEAARGLTMEIVEDELFNQCKKGNIAAIIFFLKNRDPDRWNIENKHKHSIDPGQVKDSLNSVLNIITDNVKDPDVLRKISKSISEKFSGK